MPWSRGWWTSSVGGAGGIGAVLSDPIVIGTFHRHDRFRDLIPRMRRLLMGAEASQEPRIRTATLIAALNGVATHPFVADLDEDTLRRELHLVAQLLLPPLPKGAHRRRSVAGGRPRRRTCRPPDERPSRIRSRRSHRSRTPCPSQIRYPCPILLRNGELER